MATEETNGIEQEETIETPVDIDETSVEPQETETSAETDSQPPEEADEVIDIEVSPLSFPGEEKDDNPEYSALKKEMDEIKRINSDLMKLIDPKVIGQAAQGQVQQPQVPAGFASWTEDQKRNYIANVRTAQQPAPKPIEVIVKETLDSYIKQQREADEQRQIAEIQHAAINRFNTEAAKGKEKIQEILKSIPSNIRSQVFSEAIDTYEKDTGFIAPYKKGVKLADVSLYGSRSAPEEFVEKLEMAAFKRKVGYIPSYIKELLADNNAVINNSNTENKQLNNKGPVPQMSYTTRNSHEEYARKLAELREQHKL